ncbi:5'-nucleotidase [Candidatus Mancarchaeum acidiphilum]|uniref:5'-nucleotidase n=1 Tax=Candidatus Mancarchaeum acidiphilum TaxID=1920749 RepID=A0A218NMJ0_9ARCH|nr:hypothetical protein [Candidatus Mancarchaeum acidiphilum]ASI13690.1 5'-nucleotidase [Candidatus Mancarchaeum acidiphilum]
MIQDERLTLGIDIDGTLADTVGLVLELYNSEHKFQASKEDLKLYEMAKNLPEIDGGKVKEYFENSWDRWNEIAPVDNAASDVIRKLAELYNIRIITATFGDTGNVKRWLEHNEIVYNDFVHCDSSEKYKYCDILVDDRVSCINAVAEHGGRGILMEQYWNKADPTEEINENVVIAKNWNHVYDICINGLDIASNEY